MGQKVGQAKYKRIFIKPRFVPRPDELRNIAFSVTRAIATGFLMSEENAFSGLKIVKELSAVFPGRLPTRDSPLN